MSKNATAFADSDSKDRGFTLDADFREFVDMIEDLSDDELQVLATEVSRALYARGIVEVMIRTQLDGQLGSLREWVRGAAVLASVNRFNG